MPYHRITREVKENICRLLDSGIITRREAAEQVGIPYSSLCKLYKSYCENGNILPAPRRRGKKAPSLTENDLQLLKTWLDDDCGKTLRELQSLLLLQTNKHVSLETIRQATLGFHYTLKRSTTVPHAADTEQLWQVRSEHAAWFIQSGFPNGKVICIDETGFQVAMRRTRGRSRAGTPAIMKVPAKKTRNITVIAAISFNTVIHYKILDGNGNEERFIQFLQELTNLLIGDVYTLVMDNVRFHRTDNVRNLVQNAGHELKYLPPYSPFFNPIEYLFSQWKGFVRQSAPENEPDLLNAINSVHEVVSVQNLQNYFNQVNTNCVQCLQGHRNFF